MIRLYAHELAKLAAFSAGLAIIVTLAVAILAPAIN